MNPQLLDTPWIWHPHWIDTDTNTAGRIVHFRKSITLQRAPATQCRIQITADTKYQLYINGIMVVAGPVKGDQHLWFYDEVDIQPFLRPGQNNIAVRVLRFFYATQYATSFPRLPIPGLFVRMTELQVDEGNRAESSESWETAVDLATRLRVDQAEDEFLHIYEDVAISRQPELEWVLAKPLKLPKSHGLAPPWVLCPRLIPRPKETQISFKAVQNIGSSLPREAWEALVLRPETMRSSVTLPAGTFHQFHLEAEHHMTARVRFGFQRESSAGSLLSLRYSEGYEDAPVQVPYVRHKGDRTDTTKELYGPQDQFSLCGLQGLEQSRSLGYSTTAEQSFESCTPFHFRTFRYIAVEIQVGSTDLVVTSVDASMTHYPLDVTGGFETPRHIGEDLYQSMWKTSIRTLTNCMHDCYEDCPFYEQLQYAMDVRSSCLFTYVTSADDRMARQSIIQLHNGYRPSTGLLASRGPAHQLQIIPHFSLFWIATTADHFQQAGDYSFTRRFVPTIDAILDSFARRIDPTLGLIKCDDEALSTFWDFVDWTQPWSPMGIPRAAKRTGYQSFTNFLYSYALRAAAGIVSQLGRPALGQEYLDRAAKINAAVRQHCRVDGIFTDGLARGSNLSEDLSEHSQIWAVLSGALIGNEARQLLCKTIAGLRTNVSNAVRDNTSSVEYTKPSMAMSFYTLRAISLAGGSLYDDMFHEFWVPWKSQLAQNLTTWCEDEVTMRSDCHAWSCAPLYEIMAEVAGVTPGEPGWKVVSCKPRVNLFSNFSAKVPLGGILAPGLIAVSWSRDRPGGPCSLSITVEGVPGGGDVKLRVPKSNGETKEYSGTHINIESYGG